MGKREDGIQQYVGLTVKQIAARLMFEKDLGKLFYAKGWKGLKRLARQAGLVLDEAFVRAQIAQSELKWDWLKVLDTEFGDPLPLREALLKSGRFEEAKERFGSEIGVRELKSAARFLLTHEPPFATSCEYECLKILKDKKLIRDRLRRTVKSGSFEAAERYAKLLHRDLTHRELKVIGRDRMNMCAGDSGWNPTLAFLSKHGLTDLYREFLYAYMEKTNFPLPLVLRMAKKLGVGFGLKECTAFLARWQNRSWTSSARDIVWVLERKDRLAGFSRSSRRTIKHLTEFRASAVLTSTPKDAEFFGRKIGKPLTIEELQKMHRGSVARDDRTYLETLLARRIYAALHGKKKR